MDTDPGAARLMQGRGWAAAIAMVALAVGASGCGGSSSDSPGSSGKPAIDGSVFRHNAETYTSNLKALGNDLKSCATNALISGNAKTGIQTCLKAFSDGVSKTTDQVKDATDRYIQGVTGSCRSKIQAFRDDSNALADVFRAAGKGDNAETAIASALSTLGDSQTQQKIRGTQSALKDAVDSCSGLIKAKAPAS